MEVEIYCPATRRALSQNKAISNQNISPSSPVPIARIAQRSENKQTDTLDVNLISTKHCRIAADMICVLK